MINKIILATVLMSFITASFACDKPKPKPKCQRHGYTKVYINSANNAVSICNVGIKHPNACTNCDEIIASGIYIGTDYKRHTFTETLVNTLGVNTYDQLVDKLAAKTTPVNGGNTQEKRAHIFVKEAIINLTSELTDSDYFFDVCVRKNVLKPRDKTLKVTFVADEQTTNKDGMGNMVAGGPYFFNNALVYHVSPLMTCNNVIPDEDPVADAKPVTAGTFYPVGNASSGINIGLEDCQARIFYRETMLDSENIRGAGTDQPAQRLFQLDTAQLDFSLLMEFTP